MRKTIALMLAFALALSLTACGATESAPENKTESGNGAVSVVLSDDGVTVDGQAASTDETAAVAALTLHTPQYNRSTGIFRIVPSYIVRPDFSIWV